MLVGCDFKDSLLQPCPASVVKINAMIELHFYEILESFNRLFVVGLVAVLKSVYLASGCFHFLFYFASEARKHPLAAVLHYLL